MPLIRKGSGESPSVPPIDLSRNLVLLKEGTVDERWNAARGLGTDATAASALGDALRLENDERVREAIFTSLATLNSQTSVAVVLPYLRSDNALIRTGALDALKAMPQATAGHVATLLRDPDPDVRILACELARDVPSRDMTTTLTELLDSDHLVNVCAAAIDALAEIGTASDVPTLRRCLARFPNEPFLAFSVKVATARLASSAE
jgi:HEAT repeat protein